MVVATAYVASVRGKDGECGKGEAKRRGVRVRRQFHEAGTSQNTLLADI
jgi:hypothetical protein